jgi:hypothetical protein
MPKTYSAFIYYTLIIFISQEKYLNILAKTKGTLECLFNRFIIVILL